MGEILITKISSLTTIIMISALVSAVMSGFFFDLIKEKGSKKYFKFFFLVSYLSLLVFCMLVLLNKYFGLTL